jgi:hypothetical protein
MVPSLPAHFDARGASGLQQRDEGGEVDALTLAKVHGSIVGNGHAIELKQDIAPLDGLQAVGGWSDCNATALEIQATGGLWRSPCPNIRCFAACARM